MKDENVIENLLDHPNNYVSIPERFGICVARNPNNVAVVFEDIQIDYDSLNRKANHLASVLVSRGATKGTFIPVLIEHSIELVMSLLAVLKVGGVYVPLDVNWPTSRIAEIVGSIECSCILVKKELDFLDVLQIEVDITKLQSDSTSPAIESAGNDLVYMMYTSGTTGQPKGVLIRSEGLLNRFLWMNNHFGKNSSMAVVLTTRYVFDSSMWQMLWPLINGGKVIIPSHFENFSPARLCHLLDKHKVTMIDFVPSLFNNFLQHISTDAHCIKQLDSLRDIILGGEAIIMKAALKFKKLLPAIRITNLYGPTEATIGCVFYTLDGTEVDHIPIGKAISNMEVILLDEELRIVPPGVIGEVFIGGIGVAAGYYQDSKKTSSSFIPIPSKQNKVFYRTGDLGKWRQDGNLLFLGRKDDQISIHGLRIEPAEVEAKILQFNTVTEVCVTAFRENDRSYLCAYFVSENKIDPEAIKQFLVARLPGYMVPNFIIQVEKFELSPSGKINKSAFPKPQLEDKNDVVSNSLLAVDQTEEIITDLWFRALTQKKRDMLNNKTFFEYGGDSLKMMELMLNVNEHFNVEITLSEFLKNPTIAGLSRIVRTSATEEKPAIVVNGSQDVCYRLSGAQKQMYLLQNLDTNPINYNLTLVCEVHGSFGKSDFDFAFSELISRHEILRTEFLLCNGDVVQKIKREISPEINYRISSYEESKKLISDFVRPFHLDCAPLFRALVLSIESDKHIMCIDMHHIISDGLSINILLEEFASTLQGDKLTEKVLQYKDYAEWENDSYYQNKIQAQEAYWLEKFKVLPPKLNLPTDTGTVTPDRFRAKKMRCVLEGNEMKCFNEVRNKEQVTSFTLLLSIFNILLSKWSLSSDIVIGSPVAGRRHPGVRNTIGMFANTLALRNFPEGAKKFSNFVSEVKHNLVNDFEHQDYPFERLIRKLKVRRNGGNNPLYDIILGFQNDFISEIKKERVSIVKSFGSDYGISNNAKVPLSFWCKQTTDTIIIDIEYIPGLFSDSAAHKILQHLKEILYQVKQDAHTKLEDIHLSDCSYACQNLA